MRKYITYGVVAITVSLCWLGLELAIDGTTINQGSDTIMTLLLSYLITDKVYDKYIR